MSVCAETQRLISVSLGKIAQSRGQRGGINLHKNLLVATVLHKARTAYMMESYNYQQNLHRQKLLEQYQLQQQQHHQHQQHLQQLQQQQQQQNVHSLGQKTDSSPLGESNKGDVGPLTRDSNLGHTTTTPKTGEQTRSEVSSFGGPSHLPYEHTIGQECKVEIVRDKENSPPAAESLNVLTENVPSSHLLASQDSSHLVAATQLSQEVQMASSEQYACNKQYVLPSTSTTCSVLKRRRESPPTSLHECSTSKIAKLGSDSHLSPNIIYLADDHSSSNNNYSADNHSSSNITCSAGNHSSSNDTYSADNHSSCNSNYSADNHSSSNSTYLADNHSSCNNYYSVDNHSLPKNSNRSADNPYESHSQSAIPHSAEHHQISNLVSIFNSGFSGLCVSPSSDLHATGYQSDFVDISLSLTRNISIKAG